MIEVSIVLPKLFLILRDRILNEVDKLFSKYGVRSITMDEIARELGISKKTIYQYFENKDDLVNSWTKNFLEKLNAEMEKTALESKDAVQESLLNHQSFHSMITKLNPSVFHDLKKYFPEINLQVKKFEKATISHNIERMIQRGIQEKIFRPDIQVAIVAKIHFHSMDFCFDGQEFQNEKFDLFKTLSEIQNMFLRGLCNEEGIKRLTHYQNQYKQSANTVYPETL